MREWEECEVLSGRKSGEWGWSSSWMMRGRRGGEVERIEGGVLGLT